MHKKQLESNKWSCPKCGFQVFNRRYPKCEHCGSELPAALLYSDQERQALLERTIVRVNARLERQKRSTEKVKQSAGIGVSSEMPSSSARPADLVTSQLNFDSFASGGGGEFAGGGASDSFEAGTPSSTGTD